LVVESTDFSDAGIYAIYCTATLPNSQSSKIDFILTVTSLIIVPPANPSLINYHVTDTQIDTPLVYSCTPSTGSEVWTYRLVLASDSITLAPSIFSITCSGTPATNCDVSVYATDNTEYGSYSLLVEATVEGVVDTTT